MNRDGVITTTEILRAIKELVKFKSKHRSRLLWSS